MNKGEEMHYYELACQIANYANLQGSKGQLVSIGEIQRLLKNAAMPTAVGEIKRLIVSQINRLKDDLAETKSRYQAGISSCDLMKKEIVSIGYGPCKELGDLRKGAIFETMDSVRAVKSEYSYGDGPGAGFQSQCILLESGEYAHFPAKNNEIVREIILACLKSGKK